MNRVTEAFRQFFAGDTLSPHGICLFWRPELIWTHVAADALIGLAYFSIPLALAVFVRSRPDVRFGWVIWMFVAFIMLCGVTHFISIWTLWRPDYAIEAVVKAVTAMASVATALALWPLLPKAIALPSPAHLEARVAERDQAVTELRAAMATMIEMREHEQRQKLLLDELNHRVRNTVASIQSIAVQTLKGPGDKQQFGDAFLERLLSLSGTHDLLVRNSWQGATFHELVDNTLGNYALPYTVEGPDLHFQPNAAVSMGMALHELATNALRHGVWVDGGSVALSTAVEGSQISIVWRETGATAVAAPKTWGFGSRLLERGLSNELGGEVALAYEASGLVCTIRAWISSKLRPAAAMA